MSASKPASCSCNGLRVSPYRLKIFRPLFASVLSPTFSSSSPYSPCSGLKRALSCTRSDLSRKSRSTAFLIVAGVVGDQTDAATLW